MRDAHESTNLRDVVEVAAQNDQFLQASVYRYQVDRGAVYRRQGEVGRVEVKNETLKQRVQARPSSHLSLHEDVPSCTVTRLSMPWILILYNRNSTKSILRRSLHPHCISSRPWCVSEDARPPLGHCILRSCVLKRPVQTCDNHCRAADVRKALHTIGQVNAPRPSCTRTFTDQNTYILTYSVGRDPPPPSISAYIRTTPPELGRRSAYSHRFANAANAGVRAQRQAPVTKFTNPGNRNAPCSAYSYERHESSDDWHTSALKIYVDRMTERLL